MNHILWKLVTGFGLLCTVFFLHSQPALAVDSSSCDAALVMNSESSAENLQLKSAVFLLVNQSNYEEMRRSASVSGSYAEIFKGSADYASFDQKRQEFFQQYQSSLDIQQSRSLVKSYLSDNALAAYSVCMQTAARRQPGVHVWTEKVTRDALFLTILWNPPAGVTNGLLTYSRAGTTMIDPLIPKSWIANSSGTFMAIRQPNADFRFTANVSGFSANVVEAKFPPIIVYEVQRQPFRRDYNVQNNGYGSNEILTKCEMPDQGWKFMPVTAAFRIDRMTDDAGPASSGGQITQATLDQVCVSMVARGTTKKSRAILWAHVEAQQTRTIAKTVPPPTVIAQTPCLTSAPMQAPKTLMPGQVKSRGMGENTDTTPESIFAMEVAEGSTSTGQAQSGQ